MSRGLICLLEASAGFDAAIESASARPHRVGDPVALVVAHVARASIALARGESRRAEDLIARLLRYDPSFTLMPGEDSPRLRRAVTEVRQRLGTPAPDR